MKVQYTRSCLVLAFTVSVLTACGGSDTKGAGAAEESKSPSAGASDSATAEEPGETAEPEEPPVQGKVTGDVTVTFSQKGQSEKRSGGLTFSLDCSADTTCTAGGWSATGDLAGAQESFFRNYLALDWQGGDGSWTVKGGKPKGCDDVNPEDIREFVSGTLTVIDGEVTVETNFDEYEFRDSNRVCSGAEVVFEFSGNMP